MENKTLSGLPSLSTPFSPVARRTVSRVPPTTSFNEVAIETGVLSGKSTSEGTSRDGLTQPNRILLSRTTSHFGRPPAAAQVEQAGAPDAPAALRSCPCGAPATHIVSLALEPKVPTGILPNLCLSCACVRAEEKQIARLTADANRVNGAVKEATRRCTRCHKLLAPKSLSTRHDIDMHRMCFAAEQEEIAATRVLAPEEGSPLAGLIGVGR